MKQPIRCFEGEAKPHERFWSWRNAAGSDGGGAGESPGAEPELELYGYISEYSWFEDDITPRMFKDDLYSQGQGGPVTLRINSPGGDLIAASVMKAILLDYPGKVTVKVDGMAASAATIVAMAGDRVKINESAYFMIHDPSVVFFLASLNIQELDQMLEQLKTAKAGIIDAYEQRTGLSRERLGKLMSAETWMTASEAVNLGFADEVITSSKKGVGKNGVTNAAIVNALQRYDNTPAGLLEALRAASGNQPGTEQPSEAADRLRAEVKILRRS